MFSFICWWHYSHESPPITLRQPSHWSWSLHRAQLHLLLEIWCNVSFHTFLYSRCYVAIISWCVWLHLCVQDFERANTQRVRQLFNSVDELLYEGRVSSRSESLQDECEEWNSHTPHLRSQRHGDRNSFCGWFNMFNANLCFWPQNFGEPVGASETGGGSVHMQRRKQCQNFIRPFSLLPGQERRSQRVSTSAARLCKQHGID